MDYRDLIVYAGMATAAAGVWMWSRPVALVFAGVVVVVVGLLSKRGKQLENGRGR